MPSRVDAVVGSSFTLDLNLKLRGVAFDPSAVLRMELTDREGLVVETVTEVTRVTAGHYRVTVPAQSVGGTLYDTWVYRPFVGADLLRWTGSVFVTEIAASEGDPAPTTEDSPDVPSENLCTLSATFYGVSGFGVKNVVVRFSPETASFSALAGSMIVQDVEVLSDAEGQVSFQLVRGVRGMLTVSHLGVSRIVTVPDADTADITELLAAAEDLLSVQLPTFTTLTGV